MQSNSERIREEGNNIIKKISIETEFNHFQKLIFQAIEKYEDSMKISKNPTEFLKSNKNHVVANIKFFLKVLKEIEIKKNFPFLKYQFKELYYFYFHFLKNATKVIKEEEILIHVKKIHKIFSLYLNYSNQEATEKYEDSIIFIQKINNEINWSYPNLKVLILFQIQNKYFKQGILKFEQDSLFRAVSYFNDTIQVGNEICHYFKNFKNFDFENHFIYDKMFEDELFFNFSDCKNLENFNSLDENNGYSDYLSIHDLILEVEDLNESANSYLIKCKINENINLANKLFSTAINEDESIDMELIYDSLDIYRLAYQQTYFLNTKNQPDVELEAIVSAKLGYIFFKVFKSYEKARTFLNQCIRLGISLYPKVVTHERWYIKATSALQEIRYIFENKEAEENSEKKKKYIEELKDVLKKIDEETEKVKTDRNKHLGDYLKFLIKNHSPIQKNIDINIDDEISKKSGKKTLLKLIKFYHPDSNGVEDTKTKVLVEEITKRLNDIYSLFKGD